MVDLNVVSAILSTRNGVWATFMVLVLIAWRGWPHVPAIMEAWVARRRAIAEERAADWSRIRDEVARHASELREVRTNEQECQRRLTDALRRIAHLEGYNDGRGEARQDAAVIIAADRLEEREAADRRAKDKEDGE